MIVIPRQTVLVREDAPATAAELQAMFAEITASGVDLAEVMISTEDGGGYDTTSYVVVQYCRPETDDDVRHRLSHVERGTPVAEQEARHRQRVALMRGEAVIEAGWPA